MKCKITIQCSFRKKKVRHSEIRKRNLEQASMEAYKLFKKNENVYLRDKTIKQIFKELKIKR